MGSSPEICSLEDSAEELIVGYTARSLAPEAEIAFEEHLKHCTRCRRLTAQQGAVWSALDAWQPQAVSADFDRKLAQRIENTAHTAPPLLALAKGALRPALPLAICATLAGIFLLKEEHRGVRSAETHPTAGIEQQVEHALDDMDMLKQIGADVTAGSTTPSRKI